MSQQEGVIHVAVGTDVTRIERARRYFSLPGFERMLREVWKRYAGLEEAKGHAVVRGATAEECEALNSFFGWYKRPGTDIRISLAQFETELQESAFPFTITELHEIMTGSPLLTKSDLKLLAETEWHSLFGKIEEAYMDAPVHLAQAVQDWLAGLKTGAAGGYRTLRELWRSSPEAAERELGIAVRAWQLLLTGEAGRLVGDQARAAIRIPVLAALAAGQPHALDRNQAAGRLFFQALRSALQEGQSLSEADASSPGEITNVASGIDSLVARSIYRSVGLLDDDISSSVHLYHPSGGAMKGPYVMTLRQVDAAPVLPLVQHIYVVENPAVFSTLVDAADKRSFVGSVEDQDTVGPLLMCTSGPASAAALRLLDRYIEEGRMRGSLYYSGDFDIKGVEIGNVLALRYAERFVPWFFDGDHYRKRVEIGSQMFVPFSNEEKARLARTQAEWDESLCVTMGSRGYKLFQEQFIVPLAQTWMLGLGSE
ncbi:TIGR02679 domain-containing protein [Paenibacillus hexagrammi]|uniref:TIGR02679 domain-containing protein n=1 Tax=Paenibacillus hexagrammi TaxID=2908839 RepID=A0ABY3SII7_9BACL|nr:TIGR02679 domain-containing protein [Paenibacillus sp. YPD9-1]UJF33036.1 TIGR02679 domain-containing protein [Paenibacillus sp. YPD9-1]